jgi:CRISPR-associated protein Cas6/Cse3/CasE subtype I-E
MYLTKLYNVVGDDYSIHQRVMQSFPGKRPLFQTKGGCVTVLSETKPITQEGKNVKEIQIEPKKGDTHLFTLRLNPSKRLASTRKQIGLKESEILPFVKEKAISNGFEIEDMKIEDEGFRISRKRDQDITIRSVFVMGILRVKDPLSFISGIQNGIGKHKGLGFGMLNIF